MREERAEGSKRTKMSESTERRLQPTSDRRKLKIKMTGKEPLSNKKERTLRKEKEIVWGEINIEELWDDLNAEKQTQREEVSLGGARRNIGRRIRAKAKFTRGKRNSDAGHPKKNKNKDKSTRRYSRQQKHYIYKGFTPEKSKFSFLMNKE